MSKRICLGKITSAHGIKGLVKIHPYGEDPTLLETLSPLYTSNSSDKTISVHLKSMSGKSLLAEIEGIQDRNAAEALRGTELYTTRDKLPVIEDDDLFYYEDLIGMTVIDSDGVHIGSVLAVQNYGAGDLLEIAPIKGNTFLLPFTKENVPDISEESITVCVPEGLRD